MFRAGSHHSVRFVRAFRDEIVDQNADICLIAPQNDGIFAAERERGVQACDQSLRRRLFVAARAVDLPRGVKVFHLFEFQRGKEVERVDGVVLDGVGIAHDLAVFQPLDRVVHFLLYLVRQGSGHALHVNFVRVRALGFQKELVAVLIRKPNYFVLDGGAVPRTYALDHARIQRRTVQVGAYDFVRSFVGVSEIARHLLFFHVPRHIGKGIDVRFAILNFQHGKIDASAVYAGGRSRFETPHGKAEVDERFCQFVCGGKARRSAFSFPFAGNDAAVQINARRQDYRFRFQNGIVCRSYALHRAVFH